jgi:hypothetical protein
MLSTKAGKEAYVEPVIEGGGYRFTVKVGKPKDAEGRRTAPSCRAGELQVPDVGAPRFPPTTSKARPRLGAWARG